MTNSINLEVIKIFVFLKLTFFNKFQFFQNLRSVGMTKQQEVRIYNPTASAVRFDAISGSTVHFHCSFPEHKVNICVNIITAILLGETWKPT